MSKGCEELYIKRIECGIRGIKLGTKTPKEANVGHWLNKLKTLNDGLHDDYFIKYKKIMKEFEKRKK